MSEYRIRDVIPNRSAGSVRNLLFLSGEIAGMARPAQHLGKDER